MNLYTKLIAGVLFPAQERLKKHNTVTIRRLLEKTQWWDAGKLRDLQLARLRNLLQHAAENVPYYRALFNRLRFIPARSATWVTLPVFRCSPRRISARTSRR